MKGDFVITAHWIDCEWQLKSAVLEFVHFPAPHNGFTTSELILKALYKFNIHTKVKVRYHN